MRFIKDFPTISTFPDRAGNFRAVNHEYHPGFVGYGRTQKEAHENLNRNIADNKRASVGEYIAALFMTLDEEKQRTVMVEIVPLAATAQQLAKKTG